jgi:hypothetical protein
LGLLEKDDGDDNDEMSDGDDIAIECADKEP